MRSLLSNFPAIFMCLILMVAAAVLCCIALRFFRRYFPLPQLKKDHDVSSVIFGVISLLYSLIVAFVMIAVWEDFEEVNSNIVQQANNLEKVALQRVNLPDPLRNAVSGHLRHYVSIELEKPLFTGMTTDSAIIVLHGLRGKLLSADTGNSIHSTLASIDDDIVEVIQLQNNRYGSMHSHIPPVVWFALIFGSVVVMLLSWVFRAGNPWLEYLFATLLASFITMCLTIIYVLDHPGLKGARINMEPFRKVIETL